SIIESDRQIGELNKSMNSLQRQLATERNTRHDVSEQLLQAEAQLSETQSRLQSIHDSRAWRWVTRYGRAKNRLTGATAKISTRIAPHREYQDWVQRYDTLTDHDRQLINQRITDLRATPLISIVMPVLDVSERWLRRAVDSVRKQLYPRWELCIADDCSTQPHIRSVLSEFAGLDERIKVVYRTERGHISA